MNGPQDDLEKQWPPLTLAIQQWLDLEPGEMVYHHLVDVIVMRYVAIARVDLGGVKEILALEWPNVPMARIQCFLNLEVGAPYLCGKAEGFDYVVILKTRDSEAFAEAKASAEELFSS